MPLLRRDMSDQTERTSGMLDDESYKDSLFRILKNLFVALSNPVSSVLVENQSKGQYGNDEAPDEQAALTSLLWSNRRIHGVGMTDIEASISEPLDSFFDSDLMPPGSVPEKILLGVCHLGDPYVISNDAGICVAVVTNKPHQWADTIDPKTEKPVVIDGPKLKSTPIMIGWADIALIDPIGSAEMQDNERAAEAWLNSVKYTVFKVTGGRKANTQNDNTGDEPMDETRLDRLRRANGVHGLSTPATD